MDFLNVKIACLEAIKELAGDAEADAKRHTEYNYGDEEHKAIAAALFILRDEILNVAESATFDEIVLDVMDELKKGGELDC